MVFGWGCSSAPPTKEDTTLRVEDSSVVIISIDGLRPAFYRDPGFDAPTLKNLVLRGASADGAETIYPSVTFPSHTTIITGVRSAHHGVLSNTVFNIHEGNTPRWYWEASYLKAPTLWSVAHEQGLKTALLTWPVTLGATSDWLVPELYPPPASAKETAWELTRKGMNPAVFKELSQHVHRKVVESYDQRDQWVTDASDYLLRERHPSLTLIHLINVDHVQHDYGNVAPQTRAAVKLADTQLAKMLSGIDFNKTTVFVLGDHGFYNFDKIININTLFAQQGWLKEFAGKLKPDWKVIAHPSGGTAAIYSRDPKLNKKLVQLLEQNAGQAYRVIHRKELDRLEAFPGAVCAVDPMTTAPTSDGKIGPGYSIGKEAQGELIAYLGRVRGNHGPNPSDPLLKTGFIAIGPGIPAGKNLGQIRLLDVAPTAAQIIGLKMPPTLEGRPIPFND